MLVSELLVIPTVLRWVFANFPGPTEVNANVSPAPIGQPPPVAPLKSDYQPLNLRMTSTKLE
ncbi:hypothetical protein PG984_008459 [Apiospora sp. TS-2023a]